MTFVQGHSVAENFTPENFLNFTTYSPLSDPSRLLRTRISVVTSLNHERDSRQLQSKLKGRGEYDLATETLAEMRRLNDDQTVRALMPRMSQVWARKTV